MLNKIMRYIRSWLEEHGLDLENEKTKDCVADYKENSHHIAHASLQKGDRDQKCC